MIDFKRGAGDLLAGENEVEVNLVAPIHLSAFFIPFLAQQPAAAIINISSGLGFVPLAIMPVYCATKAAIHSFSLSLRHQLRGTSIRVFEVIPPTTDTDLDKGARTRRGQAYRGVPPTVVAKATLEDFAKDVFEIGIEQGANLREASRTNPEQAFQNMNH